MEAGNPYAAPKSHALAPCLPDLRGRFWVTCVASAFVVPLFLVAWAVISEWHRVLMLFACWSVGALWILLPHLKHENRAELDLTYMACHAIGFPVCSGLIFLGMSAVVFLGTLVGWVVV